MAGFDEELPAARPENYYLDARRKGLKEYSRVTGQGLNGYLPYLEGIIKNSEIISEINTGLIEIPMKKIRGTYSQARSISFAANFMPVMPIGTEFASKWISVCEAHMKEGLNDPIKAYEYLNWFYVVEGNKRISVLKYFDAIAFSGHVTRLVPKYDSSDKNIRIYYDFMKFHKKTGINTIWFTKDKGFSELLSRIRAHVGSAAKADRYKDVINRAYIPFRRVYLGMGGAKLDTITTGDAFLAYLKVFGLPGRDLENEIRSNLAGFFSEIEQMAGKQPSETSIEPTAQQDAEKISPFGSIIKPHKRIKVAFAYAGNPQVSSWTYAHEMGRQHVESTLKDFIETSYLDNIPEGAGAYEHLIKLAKDGNDIVFATSPAFINSTVRAAIEYRKVRFLNCSEAPAFKHVRTYSGRMYEPRFLAGMIAGSVTKTDKIGYVGTYPIPGVISGINSFALGARMVNPRATIKAAWTDKWTDKYTDKCTEKCTDKCTDKAIGTDQAREADTREVDTCEVDTREVDTCEVDTREVDNLIKNGGADIIAHHNTLTYPGISKEFGVYTAICDPDQENCGPSEYIAAPVWNWGIYYEKILKSLLGNLFSPFAGLFPPEAGSINFWWGMDSGVVDIFYSKRLVPRETQKLISFIKNMIESYAFHPFTGPVYDNKGTLRIKPDEIADQKEIMTMEWFAEGVEENMPENIQESMLESMLESMPDNIFETPGIKLL